MVGHNNVKDIGNKEIGAKVSERSDREAKDHLPHA